jgi:UPF0755 protein
MLRKFIVALVAIAIVVALLVGGAFFGIFYAVYHDTTYPERATEVVITRGMAFNEIATQLAEQGVIGNAWTFRLLARLRHDDTSVRAGEYRFVANQTQSTILEELLGGGAQVAVWVTIPEGFTAKQIAERLQGAGVGKANVFEEYFMHHNIVVDGVRTKNLEGFLFPSTYLIPTASSSDQVAAIFTNQFLAELPKDAVARAHALHFTIPQIVTIASLIEGEAKVDEERPIMAGVYYNRLRIGMPLEVDATIEYALPEHKTELSFADLRINSPYNSYTHSGLPPTPIANPGAASLWAAFHPAKTEYLYYVYKGNGHHAFAKTLEEHNANVAKYLQ